MKLNLSVKERLKNYQKGSHLTDLIFNERVKAVGNEYETKENT